MHRSERFVKQQRFLVEGNTPYARARFLLFMARDFTSILTPRGQKKPKIGFHPAKGTVKNSLDSDKILFSPAWVMRSLDAEADEKFKIYDEFLGECLLQACLRQTLQYPAFSDSFMSDDDINKCAKTLFTLWCYVKAEETLYDKARGFVPLAHAWYESVAKDMKMSTQEFQVYLAAQERTSAVLAMIFIYMMAMSNLTPEDMMKLDLPLGDYEEEVVRGVEIVKSWADDMDAAEGAKALYDRLVFVFGEEEEDTQEEAVLILIVLASQLSDEELQMSIPIELDLVMDELSSGSFDEDKASHGRGAGSDVRLGDVEVVQADNLVNPMDYDMIVRGFEAQIKTFAGKLGGYGSQRHMETYGLHEGDIDIDALHHVASGTSNRIFMETHVDADPLIEIAILVDQSGSMGHADCGFTSRIEQARMAAICLAESLKSAPGVQLSVYGHTTAGWSNKVQVIEYLTKELQGRDRMIQMAGMKAISGNQDGEALEYVVNRMLKDSEGGSEASRIIFFISDGTPGGGIDGEYEVHKVANTARAQGISVYGFAIGDDYDEDTGQRMYGVGNWVHLNDVLQVPAIIEEFVMDIVSRMQISS
jgi:hypothetical protein